MKISVIIPCYNEKNTIRKLIKKVIVSSDFDKEIIVIDDKSNDGTREILQNELTKSVNCLILNEKNYGKGYSIREGIKRATGEIILIQDADLEYDPSEYPKLINPIINDVADVVYGSRFVGSGEKRILNYWHSVGNLILTQLSNMFTNLNLSDMDYIVKSIKQVLGEFNV